MALGVLARGLGVQADIAEATDAVNRRQVDRVVALVRGLANGGAVAVLGMAYKPDTPVVEQSQGVMIARALAECGHSVLIADPAALQSAALVLGDAVDAVSSAEAAIAHADVVVICTPDLDFAGLGAAAFTQGGRRRVVLDCWRVLSPAVAEVADVMYLGRG